MNISRIIKEAKKTNRLHTACIIALLPLILLYGFIFLWFPMLLKIFPKEVMPLCEMCEIVSRLNAFFGANILGKMIILLSFLAIFLAITLIYLAVPARLEWIIMLSWLFLIMIGIFFVTVPRVINFYLPILRFR